MSLAVVLAFAGWFALGAFASFLVLYLLSRSPAEPPRKSLRIPKPAGFDVAERKLVIGIRMDMKLKLSEMASLLADAVISSVVTNLANYPDSVGQWYYHAQAKICVKIPSAAELEKLQQDAAAASLPCVTVAKDGIPAAIAFGPSPLDVIDPVTRHLKLV
jgi:peptidyl-tRNA hydrolase